MTALPFYISQHNKTSYYEDMQNWIYFGNIVLPGKIYYEAYKGMTFDYRQEQHKHRAFILCGEALYAKR